MSSQMSIHDEIKEQQQKTKKMTLKGKFAYFWDYYKIHTLVVILVTAFVISFIRSYVTHKDYGFYATLINAASPTVSDETSALWADEFLEFAGIDSDDYQVYIDTTVVISEDTGTPYAAGSREKMLAMMQVGEINAIISDTEAFEGYAQMEYFYDLSSIFTKEELAPYQDYLYYTDAASFGKDSDDILAYEELQKAVYEQDIDHANPSSMENPIAVGICIPADGNKLADAGYYTYLADNHTMFQGHPSQTVLGIPVSSKEPQLALKFLEYLGVSSAR